MTRRSPPHAIIAATFSSDAGDVTNCRYQPTRYSAPAVYAMDTHYFACWPTEPKHDFGGKWEKWPDQIFATRAGTVLWAVRVVP